MLITAIAPAPASTSRRRGRPLGFTVSLKNFRSCDEPVERTFRFAPKFFIVDMRSRLHSAAECSFRLFQQTVQLEAGSVVLPIRGALLTIHDPQLTIHNSRSTIHDQGLPAYASRKARVIGILAARKAGSSPPTKPMITANPIPIRSKSGVILKRTPTR